MILGIPIGFSIIISVFVAVMLDGSINPSIIIQRVVNGGASFTTLAIPLFIIAGNLMFYGSTSKLMNLANMLIGRVPGGLANVSVVGSAFFGAVSGSGIATTVAVGSIVGPEMTKKGYKKGYTASLLAGAGTLGVMIPPSIAAIIYATVANTSVGQQLYAGTGPGLLTMVLLIVLNTILALRWGIGTEKYSYTMKERMKICLDAVPPLLMPIIILGGIFSGIITPTESAVVATLYALILSVFVYKELNFKKLMDVFVESTITISMILLIIAAATPFSWFLTIKNVPQMVVSALGLLSDSSFLLISIIIILIVILGIFMEGASIIILMTPLLLPLAIQIGYDPVHFGTIMLSATNIGVITPPMAVGLFVACKIININLEDVFPEVFYVIGVMIIATFIIAMWPSLSLWLPKLLM